jgi:hypothetical protein
MAAHTSVRSVLVLAFSLATAGTVPAQVYYGTLVGTVRDSAAAVIPNADVTATEVKTGVVARAVTNAEGDYRIATLRPGEYTVSASHAGFASKSVRGLTLAVGQTGRIDVTLEVGAIGETVSVTGAGTLLQTETAERGTVLSQREVEALPTNTRNIAELTYLTPGAVKSSTYFSEPMPSVQGLGASANQFYVDGGGITSSYMMLPTERVSIDSIQEFKVETSNTTADHGLLAGSTVSIATKHGTNEFHGTLFEFNRNDKLAARNFFAPKVPDLRYNEFGGNVGGPVIKEKLFFFASYEGSRERRDQNLTATVPTAAERAGNFTPGTGAKSAVIFNPFDVDPATGLRRPFANNTIPASLLNPIAQKYLSMWPLPNTDGFPNYRYSAPSQNDFDRYAARVDYTASSRDSVLVRFGYQSNPTVTPGVLPGAGLGTIGNTLEGRNLTATWNRVLGAHAVNQARFAYAKLLQTSIPSEFVGQNLSQEFGYANGDRVPQGIWGCPSVRFAGVATNGVCGGGIWTFPNDTYYFSDDLTFLVGSHTFKTGFLHQRYAINTTYGSAGGVSSSFSGRFTSQIGDFSGGQPFADFLLGTLSGASMNENPQISRDRRNIWQTYFQDDWKLGSKLTLQLGLRYEMNLPAYMEDGRAGAWLDGLDSRTGQTLVLPSNGEAALADVLKGKPLGFPYQFSDNAWLSKPEWGNVGPRLGVAFRPFGDTDTVIRGGYGIFYNMTVGTVQNNRNFGRPFYSSASTPPRAVAFEPPPYTLGDAPIISPAFAPGEPFSSGYVASPEWPDARIQQWNVSVQRYLGASLALEVGYVGNKLTQGLNINTWNKTFPVGYTFQYDDGSTFTIDDSTPLLQRKKYPDLGTSTSSWPWSHSVYQGLQAQLVKRMSKGLQFRVGYTRSRLTGQNGIYQDEWNLDGLNYKLADDRPNVFFLTYVWEVPGRHLGGVLGQALGGWQLAGIINLESGALVNPSESQPQFASASGIEPVLLRDPNLPASQRTLTRWFDTDAFAQPGLNQLGSNAAINSIRADSRQNVDLSLSKYFNILGQHRLQVRAEAFNVFNHANFRPPNGARGTAGFGVVSAAGPAREVQLAVKFEF